jgi:hypothetical protein
LVQGDSDSMSRTGVFFITLIAAMVVAMISQLMIYQRFMPVQGAGAATFFLAMGWVLIGLAYLVSGRRWTRETVMKAVIVAITVCAALATFGRLSD